MGMIIRYVGHACFKIINGDFSVVLDPYADGSVPGLKDMAETADQVLCSHSHMDHHGIDNVKIEEKRIDTPFKLDIIKTFHDDREGALRGPNDITVLESDGFKIVHMGDVGCMIDEDDLLKIKGCDVLMIPVGGFFTIDGKEAAKYVGKIAPKAVIPMHYRGDAFGYSEIGTVDLFLEYVGYPVVKAGSEISTDELPAAPSVLLMTPANA